MFQVGDFLRVKTTTFQDVFGTVLYRVDEVGIKCPIPECPNSDGVALTMLGGSGPSARPGVVIYDCEKVMQVNVDKKIAVRLPSAQAKPLIESYAKPKSNVAGVEID